MVRVFCVFSNNPRLAGSKQYRPVSSQEILLAVRDEIHRGSSLVNHPLYGNFRPHQQPYRTLVVEKPSSPGGVDVPSLTLIEKALALYRSYEGRIMTPGILDPSVEADYAYVDGELVRETLRHCHLEELLSEGEDDQKSRSGGHEE
ncbi:MAG: GrdX family protein [Synergistaceae bacterium]|nr:GrdX family protein [Synergistaceae bacterium]